ncbi:MAG: hypothetical protein DDT26_00021 [Dehalococcoidia bacterium]|nr:hypothetical protein [Chloroflexota bacterium]
MQKIDSDFITFVLIFHDGERIVEHVKAPLVKGRWFTACREFGKKYADTREYWSSVVVITGNDVQTYGEDEVVEILYGSIDL